MYRIFEISLASDIPLPELPHTNTSDSVITIQSCPEGMQTINSCEWFHDWKDKDDQVCLSVGRIEDYFIIRFPNLVDFQISTSGKDIYYSPAANIPSETIRHLLIDQVIPRVLGQQGHLILHASAIQLSNGQGIAFLGHSGWGKSTMASGFMQMGAGLITDDCLMIKIIHDKVFCIPNYYGIRLFDDSSRAIFDKDMQRNSVSHYSKKKRLVLDSKNTQKSVLPLNAIMLLSNPFESSTDAIEVERVLGAEELISLIEQSFLIDVNDKILVKQQFKKLTQVVKAIPAVFRITYPRKHERLEEVCHAVENTITQNNLN